MNDRPKPRWTVLANLVSPEHSGRWIGTSWEFFDSVQEADACFERLHRAGHCPCRRPFYTEDGYHLGAVHRFKSLHAELAELRNKLAEQENEIERLRKHMREPPEWIECDYPNHGGKPLCGDCLAKLAENENAD